MWFRPTAPKGNSFGPVFRVADHMSTTAPIAFQMAMAVGQADSGAASSGVRIWAKLFGVWRSITSFRSHERGQSLNADGAWEAAPH